VIAIVINVYRHYKSIGVEQVEEMKY